MLGELRTSLVELWRNVYSVAIHNAMHLLVIYKYFEIY